MNEPWIKKYSPKKVKEVVGQALVAGTVSNFVRNFPRVRKKALLLHGPTGNGKTSIVKALANEFNLELIELNASDCRNADSIISVLMPAVKQVSLFGQKKLILVDEIDGLSGHQDRGGVGSIVDVIKESNFPIILTANNAYADKLKSVRTYCEIVEFKQLSAIDILVRLREICAKENVKYELPAMQKLAVSSNGDLRAAINDLQMLAGDDKILTEADIKLFGREREESIFTVLKLIFKSFNTKDMLKISDYVDEDIDSLILWLDQNIPAEYTKPEEIALAYQNLADASMFLARISRWQHWRFLVYAHYLALAGVQQAKSEANRKFVVHQRPELLLKLFIRAAKRKKMKGIAEQYAESMHTSGNRLQQAFWPYYSYVAEKGKSFALGLDL
jgi:replication factor C large subunit